jgi:hypothetical protein
LEKRSRERKWATEAVPGLENEKKKFSLFRAFNAIRSGLPLDRWDEEPLKAGLEAEWFRQTKALATSTDTAGFPGGSGVWLRAGWWTGRK